MGDDVSVKIVSGWCVPTFDDVKYFWYFRTAVEFADEQNRSHKDPYTGRRTSFTEAKPCEFLTIDGRVFLLPTEVSVKSGR